MQSALLGEICIMGLLRGIECADLASAAIESDVRPIGTPGSFNVDNAKRQRQLLAGARAVNILRVHCRGRLPQIADAVVRPCPIEVIKVHNTYEFFAILKKSDSREKVVASWKRIQDGMSADSLLLRKEEELEALREQFEAAQAAMQGQISKLSEDLREANREIAAIRNTRSWRLTSPLRALRRLAPKP